MTRARLAVADASGVVMCTVPIGPCPSAPAESHGRRAPLCFVRVEFAAGACFFGDRHRRPSAPRWRSARHRTPRGDACGITASLHRHAFRPRRGADPDLAHRGSCHGHSQCRPHRCIDAKLSQPAMGCPRTRQLGLGATGNLTDPRSEAGSRGPGRTSPVGCGAMRPEPSRTAEIVGEESRRSELRPLDSSAAGSDAPA